MQRQAAGSEESQGGDDMQVDGQGELLLPPPPPGEDVVMDDPFGEAEPPPAAAELEESERESEHGAGGNVDDDEDVGPLSDEEGGEERQEEEQEEETQVRMRRPRKDHAETKSHGLGFVHSLRPNSASKLHVVLREPTVRDMANDREHKVRVRKEDKSEDIVILQCNNAQLRKGKHFARPPQGWGGRLCTTCQDSIHASGEGVVLEPAS